MPPLLYAIRFAALVLLLAFGIAQRHAIAVSLRPGDEVLVVNIRAACCETDADTLAARVLVSEYTNDENGRQRWIDSDFDHFRAGAPAGSRTVIWVHGNQESPADACHRGLCAYQALTRCTSESDGRVRFVIWSWPSTEVPGLLRDFREKAIRTRPVGWQLAWTIDQLPADEPISLIGYSYGARIVGGALHLLAGGELACGLTFEPTSPEPRAAMPVVFLAAATHAHWFGPGHYHGNAMQLVDQLFLTVNRSDPAMKYYSLVDKNSRAPAMGLAGPTCLAPEDWPRVDCQNIERAVGRTHDLYRYLSISSTMQKAWQTLVPAPIVGGPQAAELTFE